MQFQLICCSYRIKAAMLKRLNDIAGFPDEDKKHILYTLDALIKSVKLKTI
jgi:hypothetical protein